MRFELTEALTSSVFKITFEEHTLNSYKIPNLGIIKEEESKSREIATSLQLLLSSLCRQYS